MINGPFHTSHSALTTPLQNAKVELRTLVNPSHLKQDANGHEKVVLL